MSLLRPEVVAELDLVRHGYRTFPIALSFAPMDNGDHLLLGRHDDENARQSPGTREPMPPPMPGTRAMWPTWSVQCVLCSTTYRLMCSATIRTN